MTEKMRFEGLTLTVEDVARSIAFYSGKLGLEVGWNAVPAFAMIRIAGGGTIGLLALAEARARRGSRRRRPRRSGAPSTSSSCTDDLGRRLHEALKARGVVFHQPPHDEPWELAR